MPHEDDDRAERKVREESEKEDRPRLSAGEIWRLIFRGYWESLPYLIIFIAGIMLATWLITELVY